MSYFANGRRVRDRLMRTSSGRDALHMFCRAKVPFRIPPAFSHDPEVAEYSAGTVFGNRPLIRFRRDVILRALNARPSTGTTRSAMQSVWWPTWRSPSGRPTASCQRAALCSSTITMRCMAGRVSAMRNDI